MATAKEIVESLIADPFKSDGDPQIPIDVCKWCDHYFTIDESKAHYKNCEYLQAKEWLKNAD